MSNDVVAVPSFRSAKELRDEGGLPGSGRAQPDVVVGLVLADDAVLALELVLVRDAARLELRGDIDVHRLEGELAVDALAQGAQLEVVGGVEGGGDGDVVVDELEELLLQELSRRRRSGGEPPVRSEE